MIRKLLIANRGEIACRITRTCHQMGIAVVAVYSDADATALHVELADEAFHIGASPAPESYLDGNKIIEAAKRTGTDAIHPGFGFLAENAQFAQAVLDAGLTWIGPPPSAIDAMGKKRESKLLLKDVPLVPGYNGEDQSDKAFLKAAKKIGFPVMVKASAGGGGKGMRAVFEADNLPDGLATSRREALQAFGDDTLILEKLVTNPRHIEVQIFGDQHGNIVALGERECTIQRRHQKIIEETPSTALNPELRQKMFDTAIKIGQQLGYYSAGTVEFLLDGDKNFYFMEMNTRLQVEHPVTEMVTGFDLVRWQILVAQGEFIQTFIQPHGHAIEARIYAEDPSHDFLPATGKIVHWHEPSGGHYVNETETWSNARVDSGIRTGDEVSIYYDPMLAKVIAFGESRDEAIRKLDYALSRIQLFGLRNNIAFLRRVIMHPNHLAGNITTHFIEQHPELLQEDATLPHLALIAASIARHPSEQTNASGYWRNNPNRPIREKFAYRDDEYDVLLTPEHGAKMYSVQIGESTHQVIVVRLDSNDMALVVDGHRQKVTVIQSEHDNWWVDAMGQCYRLCWLSPLPLPSESTGSEGSLRAPMPGKIVTVLVQVGQQVKKGDLLLTLEAMKMEHRIQAPYDGTVVSLRYQAGDSVQVDAILLELSAEIEPV
jgi:acetyl/propionyl-CoA carboxylase alpha subunit